MKKVLEGELTSLAHSILKSKGDNVHELKEKAGLLYEKLCVLSFAEKHFAGKQPSIGKVAFKSAFEDDLVEVTITTEKTSVTENSFVEPQISIEKEGISTETIAESSPILEDEKPIQVEFPVETEENSVEKIAVSTEKTEAIQKEEPKLQAETPNAIEDNSTTEEAVVQPKQNTLTEEDFGVHYDDLPDFEPLVLSTKSAEIHTKNSILSKENSIENKVEKNTIQPKSNSEEKENKVAAKPEKQQPQRTMDLFSQDKKSLNDQLKNELKIGLNDRLAFTKKLFQGNVEAYNLVIAKMNDFSNFQEAKIYLIREVKPNYTWEEHEAVEQRFLEILEAKIG